MEASDFEKAISFLRAATGNIKKSRDYLTSHYGYISRDLDWLIEELGIKLRALESIKVKREADR